MGSMTENIADKAINDTRIVKQFTNPVKEPIDSDINLFDLLDNRAKRDPEGAMIEYKGDDGTWHPYSAQVFRDMVIDLAKGLVGLGVNKGDSVAIVSRTRWEWTALDMAIMSIGALTVPVYETNSASQVSWIFNDSKVTLAIAEDDGQRDKIESVRDEVPTLRNVFVIEAGGLNAIKTYGESVTDAEFWEYKEASHGDDRATIVYTSGSTGTPKGVELTHRNFAFLVLSALQYMPRAGAWPNRRLLLFLPLSHVFARFMEFFSFGGTISLALSSNMKTMVKDFETFGPTLLLAVPRVYRRSTMPPPSAPAPDSLARCSCAPPRTRANGPRPSRRANSCRLPDVSPTPSMSRWCTRRFARFSVRTPTSPSPAALRWTPSFPTSSTASACRCLRAMA